ncbi:MAG: hypothetical protein R3264_16800, partial [Anaerolineae bacterium]|nr:hypothetical protein [Anaerolineae bacterium]
MKTQLSKRYLIVALLLIVLFALVPAAAALADGPITPSSVPTDGAGIDFNSAYIREDGEVAVAFVARNFSEKPLQNLVVRIEANDAEQEVGPFNLAPYGKKPIKRQFRADPLPKSGNDIYVSVTMCVEGACAAAESRKLYDEREDNPLDTLATRIRYRRCEIRFKVLQDPDFTLSTKEQIIVSGHLDANEWSPWFDLSDFATYPASPLEITLKASWEGYTPVTEHFTIPANDMDCLP